MAQWIVGAALAARGAHAETEDDCWDRIKRGVDTALTKGSARQLREAEAAALVAYVWARSRPSASDSAAAANVLLDALEEQVRSIEAAAVACDLKARLSSSSEVYADLRARAVALCSAAEEQRGAPLGLVVPSVRDCSEPGPWSLQVMLGAEPTDAHTFERLDPSTAGRELRVEVRAETPPASAPLPGESVAPPSSSQVTAPTHVAVSPVPATLPISTESASSPGFCSGSRLLPCGLGGIGIGVLAGAAVVGGIALKKENDAAARCPARDGCSDDATARDASDTARSAGRLAVVSDALWIGGALVSVSCDGHGCQLAGGARF